MVNERQVIEWLIAESQWIIGLAENHTIRLGQLQAILAWENRIIPEEKQTNNIDEVKNKRNAKK